VDRAEERIEGPDDANDLRGFHFKQLINKPLTVGLVGGISLAVGIVLAVAVSPVVGLIALVVLVLAGIGIVFALADAKAADSFFDVYAKQRGLVLGERSSLPAATPLLRKGDERYATRTLSGALADGVDGTLALYTYEETTYNAATKSNQTSYYHYTLGLVEVPECVRFVPELYCQRKFGLRALEGFEDVFRGSKNRVELESEALADKYEIFTREGQDETWLRRLLAPTFIVWLTDAAPEKFAFELVNGTLCCYVSGNKEGSADLDAILAATAAVATRLREETAETG
jgi:hypothetical protein